MTVGVIIGVIALLTIALGVGILAAVVAVTEAQESMKDFM